ncbi:MAG: hypothetical protein MMC33_003002 [Icmadophila ericetorum]|nr:hypothetical protein [Icmadophila ericetorum]
MAQEFQLKGVTTLDLKDGEKREVEVEGVEDGKVLLVQMGNKTHAIGANCTHYGAPLKNGVLTPDGRLTCPWHGACFNVNSGDVEDAPALDPIATFELTEKNGGIYIKGDEQTIKAKRRTAKFGGTRGCAAVAEESVIVVGGGSGTMGTVQSLLEHSYKGTITILSKESYLPIDRTKLSKSLMTDVSKLALRPQEWFDESNVKVISEAVSSIDFSKKEVSTSTGKSYPYTKLVLATGGTPKMLPLPGFKELKNVFLLRTVSDAEGIVKAVGEDKCKKIVVVGSSFIGMEVANCLAKDNTITVIGMEKAPMERVMGEEVGKIFQSQLSKNGVKFQMEAGVEKAAPHPDDPSRVGAVHLKGGTVLEADLVILGVGVAPATEYIKENKAINLEKDGSLRVNEKFEVLGHEDSVYAIGDIATYPYHGPGAESSGTPIRIEHWNVAQNSGRSVGSAIASVYSSSKHEAPKPFIPVFWSALGSQLRYCGATPGGYDDYVIKGQPEEGKFAAYYGKKGEIVAVASMGMDPVMTKSAELMRRKGMPSLKEIKDGVDVLTLNVPKEIKI